MTASRAILGRIVGPSSSPPLHSVSVAQLPNNRLLQLCQLPYLVIPAVLIFYPIKTLLFLSHATTYSKYPPWAYLNFLPQSLYSDAFIYFSITMKCGDERLSFYLLSLLTWLCQITFKNRDHQKESAWRKIAAIEDVRKGHFHNEELNYPGSIWEPGITKAIMSSNCGSRSFSARFPLALPRCLPLLCHPGVPTLYPAIPPESRIFTGIWEIRAPLSHQLICSP